MHPHCCETLLNDNKRDMTSNGVDVRLRRQPQVSNKPPRLRLNARTASLHRQQARKQQQQPHQRTSSWPIADTSVSISDLKSSEENGVSSLSENGMRNGENIQSYNANEWNRNTNGNSNRPLIHHQRHNLKNRFHLVKTLGEGTYGKVKLASDKATGESVAIKYIKKTKIHDENDLVRIRREIQILSSLRHKHIVNIREVFEKKDKIVLVMDYAQGGELYDYLNKMGKLSEWEARRIFRQIVSAIHYCHQNGIVHRDLKLENIILDNEGNVKIADFGLSNYYSHNNTLKTFCGSPLYASPEIVNGKPYHGPEVDVWSLGVILYTLVHGAMPFESNSLVSLKQQISNGDYSRPSKPSDAAGLIRHMLTVTPSRRATIEDALRHWWINFGHSHLPNDLPYSPDDEAPIMPYTLTPESTATVSNPPVIIHHRNQSSISSDSDVELDFWPNRWSKRKTTLDSTGNSVSSSMAGSPAPIGENGCLSADETNDDEDDPAAIASALLKLPPDVLEILRGCSSKSLAALLNTDKISSGFDLDVNDNGNNTRCQTDECKDAISVDAEKTSSSVFDSERKPKRSILKRKGKFSGGDSGCVMHEEMALRPEEHPIPKSGHLPRRLPSFRDEAHGIFASKHRASQLLDNPSGTLHHESCSSAISQNTWYNTSPQHPPQPEQQFEDQTSHQNLQQQQQPETMSSTHNATNHCLTQTVTESITVISSETENVNLATVTTAANVFTDRTYPLCPEPSSSQDNCPTNNNNLPSGDTGTNNTCNKEPAKVVARPKSILKNSKLSQMEGARNRLSVSSLGSNSSADFLDLSYDSGDNDHFVNQRTPSDSNINHSSCCTVSSSGITDQENPGSVDETFDNPGVKASSQFLPHPGHKRTLSDERAEILGSKSSLLYRLTRDAQSLL